MINSWWWRGCVDEEASSSTVCPFVIGGVADVVGSLRRCVGAAEADETNLKFQQNGTWFKPTSSTQ
jgi:hypothetical protein